MDGALDEVLVKSVDRSADDVGVRRSLSVVRAIAYGKMKEQ